MKNRRSPATLPASLAVFLLALIATPEAEVHAGQGEDKDLIESLNMIENGRQDFLKDENIDPFAGLSMIEQTRNSEVRARRDVDWNVYSAILLQDATVEFRQNWLRDQNRHDKFRVTSSDMRKVAKGLSEQFRLVTGDQLFNQGRFLQSNSSGKHVLIIKPAIVELNVSAPDTSRISSSRQLTDSSTSMTVEAELYDSESGVLLAAFTDRLEDPHRGLLRNSTGNSNRADSKRLLQQWAAELMHKLDISSNSKLAHNGEPTKLSTSQ
jgi:hypothetical protein